MRIVLTSETSISLEAADTLAIEADDDELGLSAFHLLAASLAACSFSVLHTWAQSAQLDAADLVLHVSWTFADSPAKVGAIDVRLEWPALPEKRWSGALKAAEQCTVHTTLTHGTEVRISAGG